MTDRRQIYLVDDDDAVRRSAGFMLKTSGFAVEPFASGVEFLKGVEALAPGCILLDVRMPGMDGLEAVSYTHLDVYKRQDLLFQLLPRFS